MRPVTATIRFRFSRVIWGWPISCEILAMRLRGKRWPSRARSQILSMALVLSWSLAGTHTRTPINFIFPCTLVVTSPLNQAFSCFVTRSGSIPSSSALSRSTMILMASPARTTPLLTSTTPGIFLISAAIFGATDNNSLWLLLYNFISIGWGTSVRSPIRSSMKSCISTSRPGTSFLTRRRT